MATMASGSWTIVFSRPSRNGSPVKVRAGPRTAVGREGVADISGDVRTERPARKGPPPAWMLRQLRRLDQIPYARFIDVTVVGVIQAMISFS